jgi:glucans biosynthesis protein
MHGGASTGAPKGNKNAYKHGKYTAKSIETRQVIRYMVKEAKKAVSAII